MLSPLERTVVAVILTHRCYHVSKSEYPIKSFTAKAIAWYLNREENQIDDVLNRLNDKGIVQYRYANNGLKPCEYKTAKLAHGNKREIQWVKESL